MIVAEEEVHVECEVQDEVIAVEVRVEVLTRARVFPIKSK